MLKYVTLKDVETQREKHLGEIYFRKKLAGVFECHGDRCRLKPTEEEVFAEMWDTLIEKHGSKGPQKLVSEIFKRVKR